ncbi:MULTISPECIES: hypothetical protein [unclassified Sphingopyxis]|uniref:hypothetical protein n=1 Tax=unclassified Sphingopyxis TaxID=2614943 RepID=UPI0012E39E26|nr:MULTISPECIES: hypothetical protein [unclassified Sphingopyxis]
MLAEKLLIEQRDRYVAAVSASWLGYERELLISLVRALDVAAYTNRYARRPDTTHAWLRLRGAATSLRPLLGAVRGMPGTIPWFPSNPNLSAAFDNHLLNCGRFAVAIRWAAMERYGIATARVLASDRIAIEFLPNDEEMAETALGHAAKNRSREDARALFPNLSGELPEVRRRLRRYGKAAMGWFIGYDNDDFLIGHYRSQARIEAAGIIEAEALPPTGVIGGRPFGEWTEASTNALGTVLHHIDAAGMLHRRKPKLDMRNLMTVYARRGDILDVLEERGDDAARARQLMEGLTLDADGAAYSEARHEIPLPYYIDAGEDFVLLPMFGGFLNPHAGLLEHLRRNYRRDWDSIVDGRENIFRSELRQLLPEPRYMVLGTGLKLRRKDGSTLTDADAVVLDHETGDVVFVQLKWYDVYGFSLAERESRRVNLLTKGNEWVAKVHAWIDGRTSAEIAKAYGWGEASDAVPRMLVMARHSSRFAGEGRYDARASWTSWHSLTEAVRDPACEGFVAAMSRPPHCGPSQGNPDGASVFDLPGITVEVRTARI